MGVVVALGLVAKGIRPTVSVSGETVPVREKPCVRSGLAGGAELSGSVAHVSAKRVAAGGVAPSVAVVRARSRVSARPAVLAVGGDTRVDTRRPTS